MSKKLFIFTPGRRRGVFLGMRYLVAKLVSVGADIVTGSAFAATGAAGATDAAVATGATGAGAAGAT
ncbi:MAG: hypothetical protein ACLBM4_01060 [Dolichospermum sp.]